MDATSNTLTLWDVWRTLYPKADLRSLRSPEDRLRGIERIAGPLPPISTIDDAWLEVLRDRGLESGLSAGTVKSYLIQIQTLLRYVGPRGPGNPRALGLIDRVPYCKPPRLYRTLPRRIALDDLSKFYVGCRIAKYPRRSGVPAEDMWRTALVMAYQTGLRRADLFGLRWSQVEWHEGKLRFQAEKTQKPGELPLLDWALDHLRRLYRSGDDGHVFRGWFLHKGGRHYEQMRRICEHAGIGPFGWHDVRRTAASEVERVAPGMGAVFLQHAPRGVTEIHYISRLCELRRAVEQIRVPVGFKAGPAMFERRVRDKQRVSVRISPEGLDTQLGPIAADWTFSHVAFSYRGIWYRLPTLKQLRLLRLVVEAGEPIGRLELFENLSAMGYANTEIQTANEIGRLRRSLRRVLGLVDGWDPLPALRDHGQRPAKWTVHMPSWL